MQFLSRKDALVMISQNNFVFSINFVTANRQKQTGGKIMTINKAVVNAKYNKPLKTPPVGGRGANNFENQTINILDLDTNQIIKVHIQLITRINDIKIIP
jgi:hypothetical protein